MKNKSLLLKFGVMVLAISCFSLSSTFATNFHLNVDNMTALESELEKNLHPIHFADNGNDFWGFFYISNGLWNASGNIATSEYIYEVTIWGWSPAAWEKYQCARQVRWFYYNAERWERLWPLDQETWSGLNSMKFLNTTWWLYTRCEQPWYLTKLDECEYEAKQPGARESYEDCKNRIRWLYSWDNNWYYWELLQTYPKGSDQQFSLVMWVDYDTKVAGKFVTITGDSKLSPTFIRLWNRYPLWFVYDHNWWVGFVWCKIVDAQNNTGYLKAILRELKSLTGLDDLFYYDETTSTVRYIGTSVYETGVDCSGLVRDPLLWIVIEWIVWLWEQNNQTNVNIIWNEMDKKMQYFSTANINEKTLINYAKKKAAILCRWKWDCNDVSSNDIVCCENAPSSVISTSTSSHRKTYIIKNWDVKISPFTSNSNSYYDVFLMSGNLIIEESVSPARFLFTKEWFVDNTPGAVSNFKSAIESLGGASYAWNWAAVASLIKWNFIINGKIKGPDVSNPILKNKYFIYGKITTTDTFDDLLSTFQWRCNNWVSSEESDGNQTYCPSTTAWWNNPYQVASLVVIDQNYDSPFYSY